MIRQDDRVVRLVVHDAVESALLDLDLLDHRELFRSNTVTVELPPLVMKPRPALAAVALDVELLDLKL